MSSTLGKKLDSQHGAAQVVLEERIEPTDHDSKRYNESAGNVSKRDVEAETIDRSHPVISRKHESASQNPNAIRGDSRHTGRFRSQRNG